MPRASYVLRPRWVDARDAVGIKTTAINIDDLQDELLKLAAHGGVLVLLNVPFRYSHDGWQGADHGLDP